MVLIISQSQHIYVCDVDDQPVQPCTGSKKQVLIARLLDSGAASPRISEWVPLLDGARRGRSYPLAMAALDRPYQSQLGVLVTSVHRHAC
jgi:hypothetical protein